MEHLVVVEYLSNRFLAVYDCAGREEAQERLARAQQDHLAWHIYYKVRDAPGGTPRIVASLYRMHMADWSVLCG